MSEDRENIKLLKSLKKLNVKKYASSAFHVEFGEEPVKIQEPSKKQEPLKNPESMIMPLILKNGQSTSLTEEDLPSYVKDIFGPEVKQHGPN